MSVAVSNTLTDEVVLRYTGQITVRSVDTAAQLANLSEAALEIAKRRFRAHTFSLPAMALRRITATLSTSSDHADAAIVTALVALPTAISIVAILRPALPFALAFTFLLAVGLFWLCWKALQSRPIETCENRGAIRSAEFKGYLTERKSLARIVSTIQADLRSKRELLSGLERAMARVDEINALLATDLRLMSGPQFEVFLENVFTVLGYVEVIRTKVAGDQGLDLIVSDGKERVAIQSKLYSGSVGNDSVQQIYAGMRHYACDRCAVVTNSTFTRAARELAISTGCRLIDGERLRLIISGKERL